VGTLQPGVNGLAATATNDIGEASLEGNEIFITLVDTPTITSPAPDTLSNDDLPMWVGAADPILAGEDINVQITGGGAMLCTGTITATGDWSCTTSPAMPEATHELFAWTTGWLVLSDDQLYTVDTTPPGEAVVTSPPPI